jgi:hypothetical protein
MSFAIVKSVDQGLRVRSGDQGPRKGERGKEGYLPRIGKGKVHVRWD